MAEIAQTVNSRVLARRSWSDLFRQEDWWAIWIGLGLIAAAVALFAGGSSIKWIAVAPQKWSRSVHAGMLKASARDWKERKRGTPASSTA